MSLGDLLNKEISYKTGAALFVSTSLFFGGLIYLTQLGKVINSYRVKELATDPSKRVVVTEDGGDYDGTNEIIRLEALHRAVVPRNQPLEVVAVRNCTYMHLDDISSGMHGGFHIYPTNSATEIRDFIITNFLDRSDITVSLLQGNANEERNLEFKYHLVGTTLKTAFGVLDDLGMQVTYYIQTNNITPYPGEHVEKGSPYGSRLGVVGSPDGPEFFFPTHEND